MNATLIVSCRNCKKNHSDDCIINIVRNCMEIIEFGEEQKFEGDVFSYIVQMTELNQEKGSIILEKYQMEKERAEMN